MAHIEVKKPCCPRCTVGMDL